MRQMMLGLILLAAQSAQAQPALGPEQFAPYDTMGRRLVVPYPFARQAPAQPAFETGDGRYAVLAEWVPPGETVENWSELITLIVERRAPEAGSDPVAFGRARAGQIYVRYTLGCAVEVVEQEVLTIRDRFGYPAIYTHHFACGRLRDAAQSEEAVVMVFVTSDMTYIMQWAEHGRALSNGRMIIDGERWSERVGTLAMLTICPGRSGSPVPSSRPHPFCT